MARLMMDKIARAGMNVISARVALFVGDGLSTSWRDVSSIEWPVTPFMFRTLLLSAVMVALLCVFGLDLRGEDVLSIGRDR